MTIRLFRRAAMAALLAALPALAQLPVVPGEPSRTPKAEVGARLRLNPAPAAKLALPPVTEAELALVRQANIRGADRPSVEQRVAIGVVRQGAVEAPPAADLDWQPVAGGMAAQASVTSPAAGSMRLAIELSGVPADVQMSFTGNANPGRVEGPVTAGSIRDRTKPWWSPVTEGDTQLVEFFVPGSHDPRKLGLRVVGASHLLGTPSTGFAKQLQDIGNAGSCNVDVPCSPLDSNAAFQNVTESVAQMVFNDGALVALCTGTLLNDNDAGSQTPWFYSANHCFENASAPFKTPAQMQAVANTVATLWGFEATNCGSRTPRSNWIQLAGGATFIYGNDQSDALLLRLNNAPPSYAFFAGWDANPMPAGTATITVHHPEGDLKKVSQGSTRGFQILSDVGRGGGSFIEVLWSSGTTEPGSSGSGLFTPSTTPAGTQYLFRGGLWGGTALCSNLQGTDNFSRFDLTYPAIAQYLGTTGSNQPGPSFDYTDLWWGGQSEDGWGLNLVQHPSRIIFGVWYTYNAEGKRTWFTFSTGTWIAQDVYEATLQTVNGPPQSGAFDASKVQRRNVGTVRLTFQNQSSASFAWTVDGASNVKSLTRFAF
jgi:lysyl endopeptidase